MMTRLCVPLTGSTCQEMARQLEAAAAAGAEMIELRLDYLREWDGDSIRAVMVKAGQFEGQVIATCRLSAEGGQYDGEESRRISLMELAAHHGADYLDLEYEAWRQSAELRGRIGPLCKANADARRAPIKLILSRHDFDGTPADPDAILTEMAREPCQVVKLACKAKTIIDSLRMLEALRDSAGKRATIALSMGETGVLVRVLAGKFGGMLTFASIEAGKESAPGQLTLSQMRSLYRWSSLNPQTRVYGVIGCPVAHSMSPAIHNAAFDAIAYDGIYLPMRVEPDFGSFKAFVDGCLGRPWLGLRGCSVTIPHKKNLLQYVEQRGGEIEPLARRIGVANTLCVKPGQRDDRSDARVSAFNTDYRGALDALCAGIGVESDALAEKSVAVLGAGGVSRAVVAGLRDCGCEVTIYNRTRAKADALAAEFGATALPVDSRTEHHADVVVNCTSIGMWPETDRTPLPAEALSHRPAVFDTVYNPVETRLLREAREQGCKTIDGATMFVNQAVAQFERWTGQRAPAEAMRRVVLARLAR